MPAQASLRDAVGTPERSRSGRAGTVLAGVGRGFGDLGMYEASAASGDDSTAEEEAAALLLLEAVPVGGALAPGLKAGLPGINAAAAEATVMESDLDWGSAVEEEMQWIPPAAARGAMAMGARGGRAFDAAFDADFTTSGEEESEEVAIFRHHNSLCRFGLGEDLPVFCIPEAQIKAFKTSRIGFGSCGVPLLR